MILTEEDGSTQRKLFPCHFVHHRSLLFYIALSFFLSLM